MTPRPPLIDPEQATIGFALPVVGSVVAGVADSTGVEIAGRALQGASAALIAPAALTMLMKRTRSPHRTSSGSS